MTSTKPDVLAARVRGVNRANAYSLQLFPRLAAIFAPLVGQKIVKADGTFLAKVQKQIDALDLPCTPALHVYRHRSDYSLTFTVKTCECVQGHAYYHESTVYVGETRGGALTKLYEPPTRRTDYDAAEVEAARKAYQAAKQAADDAHSKLHPFGESDY